MLLRHLFSHNNPFLQRVCWFSDSRSQNFFEINPIHPDYNEKDFDLYNIERRKILVLDAYQKSYNREQTIKAKIRERYFSAQHLKTNKNIRIRKVDKDTGFPLTPIQQLNDFIDNFKKEKSLGLNIKGEFDDVLTRLIARFNAKSQTQLIRLLRISLANAKKNSIKDKFRGELVQQALLRSVQNRKLTNVTEEGLNNQIDEKQLDELAFQKALKEIDQKIQRAELNLRYHVSGLKKTLSKFDADYGEDPQAHLQYNKDHSLITEKGDLFQKMNRTVPTQSTRQDWSIKNRIAKLYFLERVNFIKEELQYDDVIRMQNFPVNLTEGNTIVNDLARKYKEAELQQVPDLEQIYGQVDVLLNKMFMKMATSKKESNKRIDSRSIIEETIFRKEDLLWNNIDAEEVFTPECYLPQNIDEKQLLELSPNADAELSLNRLPFNLYRHSQFETFGVFTKYKQFILKNFLNNDLVDPNSQFRFYSLSEAKRKLGQIKSFKQPKARYNARATRKSSLAKVFVTPGTGKVIINKVPLAQYFCGPFERGEALKPLIFTETAGKYDVEFDVIGGGNNGQAQCCAYALARCLIKINPDHKKVLESFGLAGSDSRKVEVKRIGLYSARVRPPYVRR